MLQCEMKPSVSTFSESCQDVNLLEAGSYRSLQFPDIKLTRLENDANCLKYLQSSRKKKRYKPLFYNSDSAAPSESEGSVNQSSDSEYVYSEDESSSDVSSDVSIKKVPKVKVNKHDYEICNQTEANSLKVTELSGTSTNKISNLFLKSPIVKLIRLENDENCFKYLNQNSRSKMPEEIVDKRLNPIVIISNPNVRGKHKASFMIKKPESEGRTPSEESKDSCYDTCINDSDSSHASISSNQIRRFSVDSSSRFNSERLPTSLAVDCSVPLKPLTINTEEKHAVLKSNDSKDGISAQILIDLVSEDSTSLSEKVVIGCSSRHDSENSSVSSELMSEESSSSEIARCFDSENRSSDEDSNSDDSQGQSPATGVAIREVTKTHDSGIGISDDAVSIMDESFILKPTFVIPREDSDADIVEGEECFILDVQFIPDDDYERLQSMNIDQEETPIDATCELCNKAFTARPSLYKHMKESHNCESIYECVHCGQIFNVKACLVYHLYAKLSLDSEAAIDETHLCPRYSCSQGDFIESELIFLRNFCSNHSMLHNQLLRSEIANQNQSCVTEVNNVNVCGIVLPSESKEEPLKAECKREGINQHPQSALIPFLSKNSENERLKRKSNSRGRIPKKNRKSEETIPTVSYYACHLCNANYSNKKGLFNHFENSHNHIFYFECLICQKLFQNSTSFASHYMKKECVRMKRRESLRCEICDNVYKNASILRKHKMNLHNLFIPHDQSPFVQFLTKYESSESVVNCNFCYESFSGSDQLIDHERELHDYFTCFGPLCSEKFLSKSELEKHLFVHFAPGESSFCSFCSKLFFTKQYLEKHIRDHLQDKEFS